VDALTNNAELTAENNPSVYDVSLDVEEEPNNVLSIRLRDGQGEYTCPLRGRRSGNQFVLDPNQRCTGRNNNAAYTYTFVRGTGTLSATQHTEHLGTEWNRTCRNGVCRTETRPITNTTTTAWVRLSLSATIEGRFSPTEETPDPEPYTATVQYDYEGSRLAN